MRPKKLHLDNVKMALYENVEKIQQQQGFVKSIEHIKRVIMRIRQNGVRMKDADGNPYLKKKMNKLHCSLQQHLSRCLPFSIHIGIETRYQNLFSDYKLGIEGLECRTPEESIDVSEVLTLEDIEVETTHYYTKPSVEKVHVVDISTLKHNVLAKLSADGLFRGKKYIDPFHSYKFTLKKSFTNSDDKLGALYLVYKNWYNSKVRSCDNYTFARSIVDGAYIANKASMKYLLTREKFDNIILGGGYPKRFSKIVKFCRSMYEGTSVKNSTVVESMVEQVLKPVKKPYKFKFEARFGNWYNSIVKDLSQRGYLKNQRLLGGDDTISFNPAHVDKKRNKFSLKRMILGASMMGFLAEEDKKGLMKSLELMPKSRVFRYGFIHGLYKHMKQAGFLCPDDLQTLRDSKFLLPGEQARRAPRLDATTIFNIYLTLVDKGFLETKSARLLRIAMEKQVEEELKSKEQALLAEKNEAVEKAMIEERFLDWDKIRHKLRTDDHPFEKFDPSMKQELEFDKLAKEIYFDSAGKSKTKDKDKMFFNLLKRFHEHGMRRISSEVKFWSIAMFQKRYAKSLNVTKKIEDILNDP